MEEQYQELAKYIGGFYPDMDVETIRKSLIEDPDKLDRAIKKLHQDKNRNWDYDEFKQAYISQYGQKKKMVATYLQLDQKTKVPMPKMRSRFLKKIYNILGMIQQGFKESNFLPVTMLFMRR
jgi:hypothetical protein